jgi:hypothetical protein
MRRLARASSVIASGLGPGGSVVLETTAAEAVIPGAQLAPLGGGPFNLSVVQVGDFAESRPAIVIVN